MVLAGWLVIALVVIVKLDAALEPQVLLAVTVNEPLVAPEEKAIEG